MVGKNHFLHWSRNTWLMFRWSEFASHLCYCFDRCIFLRKYIKTANIACRIRLIQALLTHFNWVHSVFRSCVHYIILLCIIVSIGKALIKLLQCVLTVPEILHIGDFPALIFIILIICKFYVCCRSLISIFQLIKLIVGDFALWLHRIALLQLLVLTLVTFIGLLIIW